jgi:NNP family nitrate/nitrite transporter-like MFS transporter
MTALPLLGGAVLRLVFGQMADRFGAKKTGLIGLALTVLPLLMGWQWADSISKMYLVGLLLGVAGASFAVALPLASRWYPPEYQGLVMGIAGAGNSGTVLAALFAPRLAEKFGWHSVFGLALLPLAVVALVFLAFAREAPVRSERESVIRFLGVLCEPDTRVFSLFYGVTFGGFVGLASFLSVFLHDRFGVSRVAAGDLTSVCVLAGSFLRPVGGALADRLGGIRMLAILYAAVAALMCGAARVTSLPQAVTLFVLVMACLGIGNGSVFQLVPQRYGRNVGVATGVLGAAGGLAGFLLPNLLGTLRQWVGTYSAGLFAFSGCAVLALVCLMIVQRRWIGLWIAKHGRAHPASPMIEGEPELS